MKIAILFAIIGFSLIKTGNYASAADSEENNSILCVYDPNYDWECSGWGNCINGIQKRTCNEYNNCGDSTGKPALIRACKCINPNQLFDIKLILLKKLLNINDSVDVSISFDNFGSVETAVNLTYKILNSNGDIYIGHDATKVQTQKILTKSFENLNLPEGDYTFLLITTYNKNVKDEFKQTFSVVEEKGFIEKIFEWVAGNLQLIIIIMGIIAVLSVLIFKNKAKIKLFRLYHKRKRINNTH